MTATASSSSERSSAPSSAPPARPPAGQDIDESRSIALPTTPPSPCVTVPIGQAIVLLPRRELERLAADATSSWSTDEERLDRIRGRRAAALLRIAADDPISADGNVTLRGAVDGEAHVLIADFLERGAAAVLPADAPQPVARITVRYLGLRAGPVGGRGDILFLLPEDRTPFLVVNWWVG